MKTYTAKSSATRAAKDAGIEFFSVIEVDGGFQWVRDPTVVGDFHRCPHCVTHLSNGYDEGKEQEYLCMACGEEFGAEKKRKVISEVSKVERPTKLVWHIAEAAFKEAAKAGLPQPRRKDVIEMCVEAGVAYGTARTQYQHWWKTYNAG